MKKTKKRLSFTAQSVRAMTVSTLTLPQGGGRPSEGDCIDCDTDRCQAMCKQSIAATYRGCVG